MSRKLVLACVWFAIVAFFAMDSAFACTFFFLKAKDGSVVSCRAEEFYTDLDSKLDLVPQGTEFTSTAPEGAKPLSWKTRYGFVAISQFNQDIYADGMNEAGLVIDGLWMDDAKYQSVTPGDTVINLTDLGGWILGDFRTVAEVKSALNKVKVWVTAANKLGMKLPIHISLTDATGDSIVVEWIDGNVKVWDNTANGVMTNEPNLGWHLENLRFFYNMNPNSHPLPQWADSSSGTGLMGLPGDYTPASRFVKISMLKNFSQQPKDAGEAVNLALHLINTVDIPYGPQIWIQNKADNIQWTVYVVIFDQTHRQFYYRTYENQTLRRIDLSKLELGKNGKKVRFDLFGGDGIVEDTRFNSTK